MPRTAPDDGLKAYQRWRINNPEKAKESSRRSQAKRRAADPAAANLTERCNRYGITEAWYLAQLESQNFGCIVCGSDEKLCVDHDHSCCSGRTSCGACVRAILCGKCNGSLGLAADDPERLRGLALYAELYGRRRDR